MKCFRTTLIAVLILTSLQMISAQTVFTNEDKVANLGYDIVNYFTTNSATRGSKDHAVDYNGATYFFVNAENQDTFKKTPEKYLPQFNGYCSFAIAKMNQKVPVNPETFRIDDGKLYLFYNDFWEGKPFNTIVPWLQNEEELERAAKRNWESLKNKS